MINLSEIFHSIEGEGLRSGVPTTFVRVQGCPYHCSFCDTEYAQKVTGDTQQISVSQVIEMLKGFTSKGRHCEFTGGDPSLYISDIVEVVRLMPDWSFTIQAIGDQDLDSFFTPYRERVRFAYDMKDDRETSIPFNVHPLNLRASDEVKIIVDYDNYAYMRNRVIDYLQNTPVQIVVSAITPRLTTLQEEIA